MTFIVSKPDICHYMVQAVTHRKETSHVEQS